MSLKFFIFTIKYFICDKVFIVFLTSVQVFEREIENVQKLH